MGLDEIFRRAEAALFDRAAPPHAERSSSGAQADLPEEATAASKGRILENLTEVDPLAELLAERGEASRRGRKPGSKNKPKEVVDPPLDPASLANLKGRLELTPERINEALKAMERLSAASSARGGSPAVRSTRPVADVEDDDDDEEVMVAEIAAKTIEAADPTEALQPAKPRERGTIRGRYVVGSEPKPGERWKRRLRGAR